MPGPFVPGRRPSVRETTPQWTEHTPDWSPGHAFTLPPSPPPSPPPRTDNRPRAASNDSLRAESLPVPMVAVPSASLDLPADTALRRAARFDVPGTPNMSPANGDVRHHPTATAEAFMRRIFLHWNEFARFKAEDAGIELQCPGWTGAVVEKCASAQHAAASGGMRNAAMRALFVHMPSAYDRSQLREHMLRILDTASDGVCASRVVFCLERSLPDLSSLIHGLCYVGGQVTSVAGQRDEWMEAAPLPTLVLVTVRM